jgi:hypothetical protein
VGEALTVGVARRHTGVMSNYPKVPFDVDAYVHQVRAAAGAGECFICSIVHDRQHMDALVVLLHLAGVVEQRRCGSTPTPCAPGAASGRLKAPDYSRRPAAGCRTRRRRPLRRRVQQLFCDERAVRVFAASASRGMSSHFALAASFVQGLGVTSPERLGRSGSARVR